MKSKNSIDDVKTSVGLTALNIVQGVLESKGVDLNRSQWSLFRNALIEDNKLDHLRVSKTFKWGLQIVCNIIDQLLEDYKNENICFNIADDLIKEAEEGDKSGIEAFEVLMRAALIISEDPLRHGLSKWEMFMLLFDLKTILDAQTELYKFSLAAKDEIFNPMIYSAGFKEFSEPIKKAG